MKKYFFLTFFTLFSAGFINAQTEDGLIRETIMNYINGTTYSQVETIKKAFYKDANLYLSNRENKLWIVPISEYANFFKKNIPGEHTGRIGKILSINRDHEIALVKVEILIPEGKTRYVDNFLLKKISGGWKIMSKSATSQPTNKTGDKILFIVSSARNYGDSDIHTGNSFSEIVYAHETLTKAGYTVDFVSPEGGAIPLGHYVDASDPRQEAFLFNPDYMYAIKNTLSPDQVNAPDYQAVYYVGGGSAMFGVPENKKIQEIAMKIYEEQDGIVSAICHGSYGILNLKTKEGNYLITGKKVNGFPDAFEDKNSDAVKEFPVFIEEVVKQRGGKFEYAEKFGSGIVVVDGNLITGQDPGSADALAEAIIKKLKQKQ